MFEEEYVTPLYSAGPNAIRFTISENKAWFLIEDICRVLRLDQDRILERIDVDECIRTAPEGEGTGTSNCFISESGLWKAYLESGTEEARCFQRWLFREHPPALMRRQLGLS